MFGAGSIKPANIGTQLCVVCWPFQEFVRGAERVGYTEVRVDVPFARKRLSDVKEKSSKEGVCQTSILLSETLSCNFIERLTDEVLYMSQMTQQ